MPFALFLVVKTPVSSTYVLNAVQKKPTKTSLAQSLSKLPLGLCSCPGKSYLETRSCKKTLTLRIPLRIYGQDGQEKNRQGDLDMSKAVRGKPFLLWPDLVSGPTHLFLQTYQIQEHIFENNILNFIFPSVKSGFPRLPLLYYLVFLDLQNLSKIPKCSLQTIPFFFFSSCVCKFMEMLKESSAYLKLNKSVPQPVFKQICALEPSSCNFRFRDETYSFYLRRETRMSVSPNTSPGRDFLHIPSKNNSSSSKIMNKRFSLDVLNILPLK